MSAWLDRAALLLQQSRAKEAEREIAAALVDDPENAIAHAYQALALLEQGRREEALTAAERAIFHAPDLGFTHYIHAQVLHRLDREKEALRACEIALGLDPHDERSHALKASILLALRDWNGALASAEGALAINPEHVPAANLRSMALTRLNRSAEAAETLNFALERAPTHALSHANMGWNDLHRNDPKSAQVRFREALRLDPQLEYARQGMLEALRARNPIYRGLLQYFLWMGRQSRRLQWGVIIATFLGLRMVQSLAEGHPSLGKWLSPLFIAFYVFVYLSWTSGPLFNLLLRLDPFGRLVLSREERHASNWFGACVVVALSGAGYALWSKDGLGWLIALVFALDSMAVALTFSRPGPHRRKFAWASLALAGLGAAALILIALGNGAGSDYLLAFFVGFLGLQLAANATLR